MLFGAVMALVGTFNARAWPPLCRGRAAAAFAGWLIVDPMNDYGFARFEMGYASAISVVLLLVVLVFNRVATRLFGERGA